MTYLTPAEAQQLLIKLRAYPVQAWSFDPHRNVLALRSAAGARLEIEHRAWPGWTDADYGHVYRQYRLSINGTEIGGTDESGQKRDIWDVIDLKGIYENLLEEDVVKRKVREAEQQKLQHKNDLMARENQLKRDLLALV